MVSRFLTLALFLGSALASQAQFKSLVVEEVDNKGEVPGKTYRVYALMTNESDIIDAVFGDENSELLIRSSKPFYQDTAGSNVSRDIQRSIVASSRTLKYDSWVTIGYADNYMNGMMALSGESQMQDEGGLFSSFEKGGEIRTSNGAWFATPDRRQTLASDENRVLLMQLTTEGEITGTINLHGRYVTRVDTLQTTTEPIQDTLVRRFEEIKEVELMLAIPEKKKRHR